MNSSENLGYGTLSIKIEGKACSTSDSKIGKSYSKRYVYCKRTIWGRIITTPIFRTITHIADNGLSPIQHVFTPVKCFRIVNRCHIRKCAVVDV